MLSPTLVLLHAHLFRSPNELLTIAASVKEEHQTNPYCVGGSVSTQKMGDENDEYHQAVIAQATYLGMDPEEDIDFLWYVVHNQLHPLKPVWPLWADS